jgi:glycosyltransferase involved in cell wall biosynthesis
MTPLKGPEILVRAAAYASDRLAAPIAVTLMGDGPERPRCEGLAQELEVDCRFTGWIDGPHRFDVVRHADLVAVPSVWPEPFGLVGLEAAANGVPAIAFDVGGVRQWLRPGDNGILVDGNPPTAAKFGAALAAAFSDRGALAAMRPRSLSVAREMSLARHVDRLESLLERCATGSMVRQVAG